MNVVKSTAFGVSLLALVAAGAPSAFAASAMTKMSAGDQKMMSSCMAMSSDAMMKDAGCMGMMKKMNMSDTDVKMMVNCKAMSNDAMMKDKECSSMMKMHPDMMKMGMTKK